jgi:hypothetical protein
MDLRWKHPFTAIVAGPSGSGKSHFVARFIKHIDEMCGDTRFEKVYWHHSPGLRPLGDSSGGKVQYREGLPNMEDFEGNAPNLIIVDDMMRESDGSVVDLFTKGSHHKNISVFFITQNLFHQGRGQRDISLNAHYIVCFKNPRDRAQIRHLARQVYPEESRFIEEAYADATRTPHGYLVLDLKQSTPDEARVRTSIFPDDPTKYVYIPATDTTRKRRKR